MLLGNEIFVWDPHPTKQEILTEVVGMIKDWHLAYNEDMVWPDVEQVREEDGEEEVLSFMAFAYLEHMHNEQSKYTLAERLNYLAGRYSMIESLAK